MNSDNARLASAPPTWECTFENTLPALCRTTEAAIAFLKGHRIGADPVYAANIIIEEIGTNIIKYAYADQGTHHITLRLSIDRHGIKIVLEDDGLEFNPLHAAAPDLQQPIEKRKVGGLGITLVRQFASGLQYERAGGINRLTALVLNKNKAET